MSMQATLGYVAHQGAQVFQVFQEMMVVWDCQAHLAHMGPEVLPLHEFFPPSSER